MKRTKYIFLLLLPALIMVSCIKNNFVKTNINPSTLTTVDPGNQFLTAATHASNDFEYYYDVLRAIMPWMQYTTGSGGNAPRLPPYLLSLRSCLQLPCYWLEDFKTVLVPLGPQLPAAF